MDPIIKQIILNYDKEFEKFKTKSQGGGLIKKFLRSKGCRHLTIFKNTTVATVIGEKTAKGANGWVVMYYQESKTLYIGELLGTQRNGYGVRTYQNSDVVYAGGYKKQKKSGKGQLIRITDDFVIYDGEWNEDQKHGYGILRGVDGEYEGQFFKDEMQGQGTMKWSNGDIYQGAFTKGYKEGRGKIQYGNGDYYEGDFKENLMHGKGVYQWKSGEIYKGQFQEGKMIGKGQITFANMNLIGEGTFGEDFRNLTYKLKEGNQFKIFINIQIVKLIKRR